MTSSLGEENYYVNNILTNMGNFNKNSTHNKIPFFQLLLQINSSHPLLHCLNKFHFLNIFKLKTVLAVDVVVVFFYFYL